MNPRNRDSSMNSRASTVWDMIASQAESNPKAAALAAPGRKDLDYEGLSLFVKDFVGRLNEFGLGRNDRVAIVLPNGPEMALAFLAGAAGATTAPLNPNYRESEFAFYLSDLNARALVVQSGVDSPSRAAAEALRVPVIELTPMTDAEAGLFTLSGRKGAKAKTGGFSMPDDQALVLHTSGTTARPKIVPLTQSNVCASAKNIERSLKLTSQDRCLNVMPLFHIHGLVGALLSSVAAGAGVVCTRGFEDAMFYEWLETCRPTWFTAVPTMHQCILSKADANRDTIARRPLRFIRSCSSPLPPKVMLDLEAAFGSPVIESYGMTEASHQMAGNPLPPLERKPGSVGIAAGPEIGIMDESGGMLAAGELGEIVIRGENVTKGYENNPRANASSFTDGWFRTGDQGYLDAEGYLFLTARIKEIINRGGEKVSPREVDDVLMEHPLVGQAVAFAVPHPKLGEDVAAAVVPRDGGAVGEKELRAFAFERLADYKVPTQILIVDAIPKGPTGKPQRLGLAEKLKAKLQRPYEAPRDSLEKEIATVWAEVLGIERVGLGDNFFYLGGDSLMAGRMAARVQEGFRIQFPVAAVFREPALMDFAAFVKETAASAEKRENEELASVLAELENMSEEQANALLASEEGRSGGGKENAAFEK